MAPYLCGFHRLLSTAHWALLGQGVAQYRFIRRQINALHSCSHLLSAVNLASSQSLSQRKRLQWKRGSGSIALEIQLL